MLASCQLLNFPRDFTENFFAVFDQSKRTIYLTWYRSVLFFWEFFFYFFLWFDLKILVKSRGGDRFSYPESSVNFWQKWLFFNWNLNIPSFTFLIWTKQCGIWFNQKLTKKWKFPLFFKVFLILHPAWLLNLGSELSIHNIVRLGSVDRKVDNQVAVNKALELTEK